MPLLADGSIDLKGDCHRLPRLALLPSKARAVPGLYARASFERRGYSTGVAL